MNLQLGKLFGRKPAPAPAPDIPTIVSSPLTVDASEPSDYDPNATVAVMDQMRAAAASASPARRLPLIGHLSTARQFQVLGLLLATSFALMLVAFGLYAIEARKNTAQVAASTEMQMLSQRLVRGSTQAEMGLRGSFEVLKQSRDEFAANLAALTQGGSYRGVTLSEPQTEGVRSALEEVRKRWEVVDGRVAELGAAQDILLTLSQAVSNVNQGNQGLLELTEQLATQVAGVGARESALAGNLVMLTQRIAKNANSIVDN